MIVSTLRVSFLVAASCILLFSPAADAFSPGTKLRPSSFTAASSTSSSTSLHAISPGDKLPWVDLHWGFNPPKILALPEYSGRRNTIIVGVPGAFMNNRQVPTYLENSDKLKEMGIDEVIVVAVNDGAVMGVWQQKVDTEGTIVTFFADPHGELIDACDVRANNAEWEKIGFLGRSKPFAMYVENCIVRHVAVAENDDDASTHAEALMEVIEKVKAGEGQLA